MMGYQGILVVSHNSFYVVLCEYLRAFIHGFQSERIGNIAQMDQYLGFLILESLDTSA
jgi:hypothetical protein